ncbi:MAG TPA: YdeI/OmpD-associated family protein, partial [Terriglobia bacterium]|nr:YdeI/OmpD-associated family protein [Terriglobia bacterium]
FDGVEDSGSLIKYGFPQHLVGVPKAIREQIGKQPGDTIEVALWKDEEPRTIVVPETFRKLLEQENLVTTFESLSYTHRKEYCRWISEARREATKQSRLAKAIDMLRKGVKTRPGP